jgi:hypothetical protein
MKTIIIIGLVVFVVYMVIDISEVRKKKDEDVWWK